MNTYFQDAKISDYMESALAFDAEKVDYTVPAVDITAGYGDGGAYLELPNNDAVAELLSDTGFDSLARIDDMTTNGHRQLYRKIGYTILGTKQRSLPADYMMALHAIEPDLWSTSINRHLSKTGDQQLLVRTYQDSARAFLSDKYGIMNNSQLIENLQMVVDASSEMGQPSIMKSSYLTPDAMGLKVMFPNYQIESSDGGYGIGVFISNNEIGWGKVRISPMVKRTACDNSIIVDKYSDNAVALRHVGSQLSQKVLTDHAISRCLQMTNKIVDDIIESYDTEVTELDKVLAGFSKVNNLSGSASIQLGIGAGYGDSKADSKGGIINAITYMAHRSGLSSEEQEGFETMAGKLLVTTPFDFEKQVKSWKRATA